MNILGEGFPQEIIDQVEIRQKIYGSGYESLRSSEEIIYLNANTAWCKLVSAANVTDWDIINNTVLRDLGYANGDDIARDFILFNGTKALEERQKSGLDITRSDWEIKAYNNWGIPSADFGFRPMAGITSVTVKHKNRGSIRTATVNIKAWDKVSFEIIDILYLRLGFSVLLEWGNSMYFDNKGNFQSKIDNSLAESFLDQEINGKAATYKDFLEEIKSQRLKSYGNYDAMFAKVTNFHWSFQPDGSYDIVLDLVSAGDIIESFKVKGNATNVNNSSNQNQNTQNTDQAYDIYNELKKYAPTNDIIDYLYKMANLLKINQLNSMFLYNISKNTDFSQKYWDPGGEFEQASNSPNKTKDACLVVPSGNINSNYSLYLFVRLGNLLKFIEEGIMYKIVDKNNETSLLSFDYNIEDNIMHVPPQMMSYDPSICMARRTVKFPDITNTKNIIDEKEYFNITRRNRNGTQEINDFADPFMVGNNLDETGKIMNIYVNADFILSKINELTNQDTNELPLIDFLKAILSGINSAFAGYSKLDLFIDETTNTLKIIDQNPLPSNEDALKYVNSLNTGVSASLNYALFEVYGYIPSQGNTNYSKAGFINEFKFSTELTPEFSTIISVSATSQGNVVGENNTALSKLNLGLEDKYKKEINGGGIPLTSVNTDLKLKLKDYSDQAGKEYREFARNFKSYLENLYKGNWLLNEVKEYKPSATMYFKLYKKYQKALNDFISYDPNKPKSINDTRFQPGTGFIPFNLSLKMNGLSGMKIGSKFEINTSYLPSNYPNTVDFLIKNITHEIRDNKWTTSLESYCIAKGSKGYKSTDSQDTSTTTPTIVPTPPPTSGDRSRCAIKNIPTTPKYISVNAVSTYFKAKGYSKAAIAGILGNIKAESALNMNAFNPAGGGCGAYGLAQWRGSRQTGLYNYSKALSQPIDAVYVQLGYMYQEIESSQVRRIKNSNDPREVAYIVASEFERFTDSSNKNNPEVIKRQNFASQFINQIT